MNVTNGVKIRWESIHPNVYKAVQRNCDEAMERLNTSGTNKVWSGKSLTARCYIHRMKWWIYAPASIYEYEANGLYLCNGIDHLSVSLSFLSTHIVAKCVHCIAMCFGLYQNTIFPAPESDYLQNPTSTVYSVLYERVHNVYCSCTCTLGGQRLLAMLSKHLQQLPKYLIPKWNK